ncbi:hypothetical protein ACPPVO_28205 [Dactylosporangium sp. McL0621]|uniref:hypothetical protein n=1 Tax=Dactylosporangium sp. McL0621 TaxID=3415678 RepID=UPI003CE9D27E
MRGDAPARRRSWLAPVTAALVALAVLAGIGVALNRKVSERPGLGPAPAGHVEIGAPIPEPWPDLQHAAQGTRSVPADGEDQLHVRATMLVPAGGPGGGLVPQVRDTWYEVQGMITVRELYDGRPAGPGPKGEDVTELDRQSFAEDGPGLRHPTPEWLAGLPGETMLLLQDLGLVRPAGPDPGPAVWNTCAGLIERVDPLLSSRARVALLAALGLLPDLVYRDVTIDGRHVFGIGRQEGQDVAMLLFDPQTAHVLGRLQLIAGGGPAPTPGVVDTRPSAGTMRIGQQLLYDYEVVHP